MPTRKVDFYGKCRQIYQSHGYYGLRPGKFTSIVMDLRILYENAGDFMVMNQNGRKDPKSTVSTCFNNSQLIGSHEHLFFFGGFALYSHCTVRGTKNIQETHAVSLLSSFPIARTEVSFSIGLVVSWGQIPKDSWDEWYI